MFVVAYNAKAVTVPLNTRVFDCVTPTPVVFIFSEHIWRLTRITWKCKGQRKQTGFFIQVLLVLAKGHVNWMGYSSRNIRTCCCAAWRPAAEILFGLSWVLFCRSPPATEETHGCSPSKRENTTDQIYLLKVESWPDLNEIKMFSPCCWHLPSPDLFCQGGCLWRRFPPRHCLCFCSHPHNPQTPKTQ